jgi:tRNA 2-thiouridine synthesizing protein E
LSSRFGAPELRTSNSSERRVLGEAKRISFGGVKSYTLDEHGFLNPPEQWDEEFAEGMAKMLGILGGLTPDHWEFIRYLRKKFVEEKTVPLVVQACAENKLRLSRLALLFPTGYHRGACKIAGINYRFMYENNYWLTCESYVVLKSEYRITPLGFLEDFNQWNLRFAQLVASEWDLPQGLNEKHMQIIYFLRDFYSKTKNIPTVFATCKANEIDLDELRCLFPGGYRRGACRMAGLPFSP